MVFANLQEKEKDAFFSLLDEYFQSRPEIFAALSSSGQKGTNNNNPFSAAALAASNSNLGQRAVSAAPGAANAASSFARRNFGPSGGGGSGGTDSSTAQDSSQQVAGRVAAAAAAFSQNQHQRATSTSSPTTGNTPNRLSNVDTSSLKSVFANRASASMAPSFNKAAVPPPSAVRSPPQPEPEPEDEGEEGQWAEALYDYVSDEPGDLNISENQQIWVTERNSDEWWTGEVDGKSGMFPASYVKLL